MDTLSENFSEYYKNLDEEARNIAGLAYPEMNISEKILESIHDIYHSVNHEKKFNNDNFESAYHLAITPFLEFFIARILYHFSENSKLNWKICLRRQFKKTSPDIRILLNKKTIAIIEIKANPRWMQACFSEERAYDDRQKILKDGEGKDSIKKLKDQVEKYKNIYGIEQNQIFFFIPTLIGVDRIKYSKTIEDYRLWFSENIPVNPENLILLSDNPRLDLEKENERTSYQVTNNFKDMLQSLKTLSH